MAYWQFIADALYHVRQSVSAKFVQIIQIAKFHDLFR